MRHSLSGRQLSRNASHRRALLKHLAVALFTREQIKTTLPKAKELRRFAERLITLAKKDTLAKRRLAFDRLRSRATVNKLFTVIGPRYQSRPGGYLRILKCDSRKGDAAPMAYVLLVTE